jgi:multicomponent Na+:H+ antiporter subunit C
VSIVQLYGLCAAALVGLGLYGLIANPQPLRKLLAFNVMGTGIFLVCAVFARRGAGAGMGGDPVPQALLITAIVVAFAASALAVALMLRLFDETGKGSLSAELGAAPPAASGKEDDKDGGPATEGGR